MKFLPVLPLVLSLLLFVGCQGSWPDNPNASAVGPHQSSSPSSGQQEGEANARNSGKVTLLPVPNGGIQTQAVTDSAGTVHLIYFKGPNAGAGNLFYVRREAANKRFSDPIRVNSRPGTVCAVGSVRGGQIALGKGGRVHIVWNGLGTDYTRLNDAGTAFEEQRNLMRQTYVPDGGGTVAADPAGNVYVVWHGQRQGVQGEDKRQVWVASSTDDGKTFSGERPAWSEPTGVCPCCSTRALADHGGSVYLMYRSATAGVHRDTYILSSPDRGQSFRKSLIHEWRVAG